MVGLDRRLTMTRGARGSRQGSEMGLGKGER